MNPTPNELQAMRAQAYPAILNDEGVDVKDALIREQADQIKALVEAAKLVTKDYIYKNTSSSNHRHIRLLHNVITKIEASQ